jgi:hypothetical protein
MSAQLQTESKVPIGKAFTPVPTGLLQRKCACGSHTMAGSECEECSKNKGVLQRKLMIGASTDPLEQEADRVADQVMSAPLNSKVNAIPPRIQRFSGQASEGLGTAPPSVDRVLASPGRPLESALRQDMEQRFGHDFSHVRVHSDATAEQSARDVNAHAYTVGRDIVFSAGRFAPGTNEGRRLIGHELTHVVQQRGEGEFIQRKLNVEDFDVGSFDLPGLQAYLAKIQGAGKIEDHSDSDDKARTIVKEWRKGTDDFILDPPTKVLLIKEMQSGFTGDDDERAILTLLLNSAHADVEAIFAPKGIDPDDLDSDFHGAEEEELRAFFDREFVGGRKAALKSSRKLQAQRLRGLSSPYAYADLRAVIDQRTERIDRTVRDRPVLYRQWYADELARQDGADIYAELQKLTPDERDHAAADMTRDRVKKAAQADVLDEDIASAKDKGSGERLTRRQVVLRAEVLMLDMGVQPVFKDIAMAAPKKKTDFLKETKPLTAAQKSEARTVISPVTRAEAKAEATGAALPPPPKFKEQIEGEKKKYGDKVAERIPKLIDDKHDAIAKGRTEKEHGDPKQTHQLFEMQAIANQSKAEVDSVFGAFYNAKAFKSFQADKRNAKGKLIKKGNLHDAWQDEEDKRKANAGYEKQSAKFWLFYLIQNDDAIGAINSAHDASPNFGDDSKALNEEAKQIRKVGDPFVTSESKRLFEIGRAWDAFQISHEVFVQLFKNPNALEDRRFLWDMFFTLMHEYLHSLAHPKYDAYASKLGGEHSTEGSTLIEGVDSLFTEITWTRAKDRAPTDEVRKSVEPEAFTAGEPFDPELLPVMPHARADTYPNAVKLVKVVGIRNLYAAYFQGEVKLIGK